MRKSYLFCCAILALALPALAAGNKTAAQPIAAPANAPFAPQISTATATDANASTAAVFGITPSTFSAYGVAGSTCAISTSTAYGIVQSTAAVTTSTATVKKEPPEPVSLSGVVLTPTAYRSFGLNSIGMNLDINAAYYIGRLYGKNSYDWSVRKENYIDRIGLWMLMGDGKMVVQSEEGSRPAIAAGAQTTFLVRDAAQPSLNGTQTANASNGDLLYDVYMVASKRIFNNHLMTSVGYMDGTENSLLSNLSEYLSNSALVLDGRSGQSATSPSAVFASILWLPRPDRPIGLEIIMPQGAPMHPKLINMHFGTLLHLNFELAYLSYDGGWDALGMFQFRYNYFPRRGPSSQTSSK
jgi:hypothetical protein